MGVCAPLIPENKALISPNPFNNFLGSPKVFAFAPQIPKNSSAPPPIPKYKPILHLASLHLFNKNEKFKLPIKNEIHFLFHFHRIFRGKNLSNNTGTTYFDSLQGSHWADERDSHNEVIMAS